MRRIRQAALLFTLLWAASAWAQTGGLPENYTRGLRLRATLDATPHSTRTAGQYTQSLNAFRAVYHADRADPNAAASVEAVAELLAEQGRLFHNPSLLRAAVDQLEFLRRNFGASLFAIPALLTEGEIETRDLHDSNAAQARFTQFLQSYPHHALAPQARAELEHLGVASRGDVQNTEGSIGPSATASPSSIAGSPASTQMRTLHGNPGAQHPPAEASKEQPAPAHSSTETSPYPSTESTASASAHEPGPTAIVNGIPVFRPAGSPGKQKLAPVTGIRHWSTASYTRIAIDLASGTGDPPPFEASRVPNPDRIFFDLHGASLAPELAGKAVTVTDGGFLERIRAAQFSGDIVRVVLDVSDVSDYSAFWLPNPSRLIIDVHGRAKNAPPPVLANAAPGPQSPGKSAATTAQSSKPQSPVRGSSASPQTAQAEAQTTPPVQAPAPHTPSSRDAAAGAPTPHDAHPAAPDTFVAETTPAGAPPVPAQRKTGNSVAAIAALSRQPTRVRATGAPTTAPVAAVTAPQSPDITALPGAAPVNSDINSTQLTKRRKRNAAPTSDTDTNVAASPPAVVHPAEPDSTGNRSLARALGLKINRIVVDAGHGGHDSGTLGPGGIQEKDVVLDVALRLGKLLKQRLGADVIYTRDDDTFIPLETRTAIANKAQADLFLSVHANSSPDASARGVETYYLNFTTSADALEVAARENAVSAESIHQLSDLVKKITLQDKIAESREFAADIEGSLYAGLETGNAGLKDRGVKKAPFVVLIGANMPSILAEISFLTNPDDATQLRESAYKQRIAESLYKGVARYVRSLSGVRLEESTASR